MKVIDREASIGADLAKKRFADSKILVFLWLIALLSPLTFLNGVPTWVGVVGKAGFFSFGLLLLRLISVGFAGYERKIGLQIIRRNRHGRVARILMWTCLAVTVCGLALLIGLRPNAYAFDFALSLGSTFLHWARILCLALVALSTLVGLLLLIAQRFSIFGTTSIFGVVLGVAALLVVQSVATGFQHDFERRVLGVYAHINVTQTTGIREYRELESWLRNLDGVDGASPFVYTHMGLAATDWRNGSDRRRPREKGEAATVLVKGIEPSSADEVIDVRDHLERGSGRKIDLSELTSSFVPTPVAARKDDPFIEDFPWKVPTFENEQEQNELEIIKSGKAESSRSSGGRASPPGRIPVKRKVDSAGSSPSKHVRSTQIDKTVSPLEEDDWKDPPAMGENVQVGELDTSLLPSIFVGVTLARELSLQEGDVVRLVDPGGDFDRTQKPNWGYYKVAGIFQAGFQEYDSRLVYVNIRELQKFRYEGRDLVSGVDLRLAQADLASDVGDVIRQSLSPKYAILEWQDLNENLFSSIQTQKAVVTILLGLVSCVASFNVMSALWTMVVRRTPEIAIIMSMGATGPEVGRIFQVTGILIGLAGSLAGIVFGLIVCLLVELYGYSLDPEVYFIERLPVEISMMQILWILGLSLGFCFVATIPPALRAARLRPVEGLRYE